MVLKELKQELMEDFTFRERMVIVPLLILSIIGMAITLVWAIQNTIKLI